MKRAYTLVLSLFAMVLFGVNSVNAQSTTYGDNNKDEVVLWLLNVPDGFYLERFMPNHYSTNKSGNFAIGAGAHIRLVTTADIAGTINTATEKGFIIPSIANNSQGMSRSQVFMNPYASQIYAKGAGVLENGRKVEAFISMNFMGEGNIPQLYQAYVKYCGFTIGKTWNTMSDINSAPPTVDYWSPSGFTGFRNATVRYENWISDRFSFGASLETPMVNGVFSEYEHLINQTVPDVTGYIQYNWGMEDNPSTVRLSALYRYMSYYNDVKVESDYENGFGAQISGKANIADRWTVYYRGMAGYGITSYINDLSLLGADVVPRRLEDGTMTNLGATGWYIGAQYDISDDVFVSATYSQSRIYMRESVVPNPDNYRYSQYIVGNCFWTLTKNMQVAVEALYGVKSNFDSTNHYAHRLNVMVQYNF